MLSMANDIEIKKKKKKNRHGQRNNCLQKSFAYKKLCLYEKMHAFANDIEIKREKSPWAEE